MVLNFINAGTAASRNQQTFLATGLFSNRNLPKPRGFFAKEWIAFDYSRIRTDYLFTLSVLQDHLMILIIWPGAVECLNSRHNTSNLNSKGNECEIFANNMSIQNQHCRLGVFFSSARIMQQLFLSEKEHIAFHCISCFMRKVWNDGMQMLRMYFLRPRPLYMGNPQS